MTHFNLSHMAINAALLESNHSIMNDLDIDLQLYCCKFYDEHIEVKHT